MAADSSRWVIGLWPRRRVLGVDLLVIVILTTLVLVPDAGASGSLTASIAGVISVLTLAVRHRFPEGALVLCGLAALVTTYFSGDGVDVLPFAIVAGSVIAVGLRRKGIVGATLALVGLELTLLLRGGANGFEHLATPFVLALGVAIGLALDYRRRGLDELHARIHKAEQARDAEARRAVAEERIRIARELHDVVAHHVAVVGVHAGTAELLLELDPVAARAAIVQVRESSGTVLRELATLLELLRGTDESPRAPAPSLDRLDDLIKLSRDAGLEVDLSVVGEPRRLAPVVDMAAYRLIQESLTNAHKHGRGTATVEIAYLPAALSLEIRNVTGDVVDATDHEGYGLIGMGERASAVGGHLQASAEGQVFVVRAELPAPEVTEGP